MLRLVLALGALPSALAVVAPNATCASAACNADAVCITAATNGSAQKGTSSALAAGGFCGCVTGKLPSNATPAVCTDITLGGGTFTLQQCKGGKIGSPPGVPLGLDARYKCSTTNDSAGKVVCKSGSAFKTDTGTCVAAKLGTANIAAADATPDGTLESKMWGPAGSNIKVASTEIKCANSAYAETDATCVTTAPALGAACYTPAGTPNNTFLTAADMRCSGATGATGTLRCLATHVATKATNSTCTALVVGASCDSTKVGADSVAGKLFQLDGNYVCAAGAVVATATKMSGSQDTILCAEGKVPCQKTGNSSEQTCAATCSATAVKLGGACSSATACTKAVNGSTAVGATALCENVNSAQPVEKQCKCPGTMDANGANCSATATSATLTTNNTIGHVCDTAKPLLQTIATGYKCTSDELDCAYGYLQQKDETGTTNKCALFTGMAAAMPCKPAGSSGLTWTNGSCAVGTKTFTCTTNHPKVCAINPTMCGTNAGVGCKCPTGYHKAVGTEDADANETLCTKTVVDAACDNNTIEATKPLDTAGYACAGATKIACATNYAKCTNAGTNQNTCQLGANTAAVNADLTLCPNAVPVVAATTAAPSSAATLAAPVVGMLLVAFFSA